MRGLRPASALATVLLATSLLACGAGAAPGAAGRVKAAAVAPTLRVTRAGEEVEPLAELHDDARAVAVYSAQGPGVSVSGNPQRVQVVARLVDWAHGGEVTDPPPLAAIRVGTFQGLEATQVTAMINLVVSTTVFEEQLRDMAPESSAKLATALERAAPVAQDQRVRPDCQAPCRPWPWQTRWSVLTMISRAQWRQGARLGDAALLAQSEQLARRALSVVPAQAHPLTTAVSERLLGAVLDAVADINGDDAVFRESLAATRRALAGFGVDRQRYDWALTQRNLQGTQNARMAHSASSAAATEALAASDLVLSVLDARTPKLRAQALLDRALLLRAKGARSGDPRALSEALRVLQDAGNIAGSPSEPLAVTVALARCDVESEQATRLEDVPSLKQAVARCEGVPGRLSLSGTTEAESQRSYGLALGRLAVALGDAQMLGRAVEQLERAIEAFDRIEGKRAGAKVRADYAWALLQLGRLSESVETARKAAAISEETLEVISKQGAPLQWSQMKQIHGLALLELGWKQRAGFQMELATSLYQQSRSAFVDALGTVSKDDNPRRWGELQRWVGQTYLRESEAAPDTRQELLLFNQALASFQRALTVSQREDDPDAFAHTQLGLGSTYLVRADHANLKGARDAARRSAAAFRLALATFQQVGAVKYVANTKAHLADALDILQGTAGASPCEALQLRIDATAAYPSARGIWTPAQTHLDGFDRSRFDRNRCPGLPASFWQTPAKPEKTP